MCPCTINFKAVSDHEKYSNEAFLTIGLTITVHNYICTNTDKHASFISASPTPHLLNNFFAFICKGECTLCLFFWGYSGSSNFTSVCKFYPLSTLSPGFVIFSVLHFSRSDCGEAISHCGFWFACSCYLVMLGTFYICVGHSYFY